jgi:hypothetical protein
MRLAAALFEVDAADLLFWEGRYRILSRVFGRVIPWRVEVAVAYEMLGAAETLD